MKQIGGILLMVSILLCGCGTTKKMNIENGIIVPQEVNVSVRLGLLCSVLNEYINEKGSLLEYIPDEMVIQEYSLKKVGREYWLSGFLTVNSEFSSTNPLTIKGGRFIRMSTDTYTYSIPIADLNELLHLPGITNVDCAKPTNLK